MIIIEYSKKNHKQIIRAVSMAILHEKTVAIPTDTSYALAALAPRNEALDRLYAIKGRSFDKPIHIFHSSLYDLTDVVSVDAGTRRLLKEFWPGPLTLVLPFIKQKDSNVKTKSAWKALTRLSAHSGFLGFRKPNHAIPLDIVKTIKGSITATSANVSGMPDCYSGDEIIAQYKNRKLKPDILIYVKSLPKKKPSTVLKIEGDRYTILRQGPITEKQIQKVLNKK
ncbi:MAG: L-threonylcarbamoyladenylate synthase [bacterium]|nr:L-threonylcarbamoyladenylate synthase [bacterium]